MATIQRPTKEGSVRTYQEKVGLGFVDILASEMDADLDTIYAAWNGGADSVNVKDGSITYAKLAPDAKLWADSGSALVPGANFTGRSVALAPVSNNNPLVYGARTVKGRLVSLGIGDTLYLTANAALNVTSTAWVQDDAVKSSWVTELICAASGDKIQWTRLAPGGIATTIMTLDAIGTFTISPPGSNTAAFLGYAYGGTPTFRGYAANGSATAPTPLPQYATLVTFSAAGCYQAGINYSEQGKLYFYANETWSSTARGTAAQIAVTPNGTTSLAGHTFNFDSDGSLRISGPVGQKSTGTTWSNPSDRRLKDDIEDYPTGLAAIAQLQPRTFVYNGKGGSTAGMRGYGFIADEVATAMPEMVGSYHYTREGEADTETDYATVDQSNLILALVNAVRELAARIVALEAPA